MATQQQTIGMSPSHPFGTAARWLKVWVGLGVLSVVIVALFLLAIISALRAIDRSLAVTEPTVGTIRGATDPLAAHIDVINKSLTDIDAALKPIPQQADTIIGELTSIDRSAAAVDSSLAQTSSILTNGLGQLKTIDDTLEQADEPGPDNRGVKVIIQQAANINPLLTAIERDTTSIDRSLNKVNGAAQHVFRICNNTVGRNCKLDPPPGNAGG